MRIKMGDLEKSESLLFRELYILCYEKWKGVIICLKEQSH